VSLFVALCLATGLLVALLLWGEQRGARPGGRALRCSAKPLASACFIAAAVAQGALQHGYGQVLLAGLVLAALGDVLLSSARRFFLGGLFAFLAGHLAYAAAFVVRGVAWPWAALALAPLTLVAGIVGRWLWPHVERSMRLPVVLYIVVISAMVALAAGTYGEPGAAVSPGGSVPWTLGAGAAGFFLSDLAVARDRFVRASLANRLWGLPLYYAAQLALAASAAA